MATIFILIFWCIPFLIPVYTTPDPVYTISDPVDTIPDPMDTIPDPVDTIPDPVKKCYGHTHTHTAVVVELLHN